MSDEFQARASIDGRETAEAGGLAYVSVDEPGLSRRRTGRGFCYRDVNGRRVADPAILKRIRALAIPPAWTKVWICPDENGHIQAAGQDGRGRKQYRYHARFREAREQAKFEHMMVFAEALPALRGRVAADMARPGLSRPKVLATVVHLLEATMIRVGNATYAQENKSYGLTTLLSRHVKVEGEELRFHFKGKSGKVWRLGVRDRRIARIVRSCQELPGQQLFQYLDETGRRQTVASSDVNAYLKAVSGVDITAKDFRTWSGTVLAAMALAEFESTDQQARAKTAVTRAIARVSARLGNTPAICRKCYIHPEIISAYLDGALLLGVQSHIDGPLSRAPESLRPEEAAVLMFLRTRVARDLEAADAKTTPPISGRRPATRSTRRSRPHPAEAVDRRNGPARASRM